METAAMGVCTWYVSSYWRGMSTTKGVFFSSLVVFATLGYTSGKTTTATSTTISLPISQDASDLTTIKDTLPSTLPSVPFTESSSGPTYTSSSSGSTLSSSSSSSSKISSNASSTSTDSASTLIETLIQNSSTTIYSTSQTSNGASLNISNNHTTSRNLSSSSSPSEVSAKTAFTPTSFLTSSTSSPRTIISQPSLGPTIESEEVSSTDESSSDFPERYSPQGTTQEVPVALNMTDEQEFERREAVGSTSNNSSSELPKIHFTLFTDWWHATILLGVEVFFYIITLGIIYFMRRNNIRWPQVMQDDSDSQSDTEPFG